MNKKIEEISKRISKSNILSSLFTGAVVFLFIGLAGMLGAFSSMEFAAFDSKVSYCAHPDKADSSIVLVSVDQKSLDFFENNGVSWPWPREFYAMVIKFLGRAGAKAILFDIDFSSSEIERLETEASGSEAGFASAITESGNVVMISSLSNDSQLKEEKNVISDNHLFDNKISSFDFPAYSHAVAPLKSFEINSVLIGAANMLSDSDGIIRSSPVMYKYNDRLLPSASMAAYLVGEKKKPNEINSLINGMPLNENGSLLINWYGINERDNFFDEYSIHSLIVSEAKIQEDAAPDVSYNNFKNKTIIIGGTAYGLMDYKPIPITSSNPVPGMEIHATILSNLNKKDFITNLHEAAIMILVFLLAVVISFIFLKTKNTWLSILIILSILFGVTLLNIFLYYNYRIEYSLVIPQAAIILSFIFSAVNSYVREGKQKREIKRVFTRYLSAPVVNELLLNPDEVELGGREVNATVFFSDIKDFTTISEKYSAKELVEHLNDYFAQVSGVILDEKAMLDKYIGDAIMAVFGVPMHRDDHAYSACLTALKIQDVLNKYYSGKESTNRPVFETRIGISSGKMIVGNIGTRSRLDYTAMGDTVNIASRLEGMNKNFGTNIIIGESTYNQTKEQIEVRELDYITVKGKNVPLKIYELIADKGEISETKSKIIELFNEGLKCYRAQNWDSAIKFFEEVLAADSGDKPSKVYITRCNHLKTVSLPKDWDGVHHFFKK